MSVPKSESCNRKQSTGVVALKSGCPTTKADDDDKHRPCDKDNDQLFQPFPTEGLLFNNMNLQKSELSARISGHLGKVRSYKMISIHPNERGQLDQYRSGPNFQGGSLTLCTCAHQIRAEKKDANTWKGTWLAGFTSPKLCGRTWLFYLAQVEHVYPTAATLWAALPASQQQAKTTRRNRLGDAFHPNPASPCTDPFNAAYYHPPMPGHSHHQTDEHDEWMRDIEYFHSKFKRHAVYIIAKPERTFLWQKPTLFVMEHARNQSWPSVDNLLASLTVNT